MSWVPGEKGYCFLGSVAQNDTWGAFAGCGLCSSFSCIIQYGHGYKPQKRNASRSCILGMLVCGWLRLIM